MRLQMLGEILDSAGQDGDLYLRRSRVARVPMVLADHQVLLSLGQGHSCAIVCLMLVSQKTGHYTIPKLARRKEGPVREQGPHPGRARNSGLHLFNQELGSL